MDVFAIIETAWGILPVDNLFQWLLTTPQGQLAAAVLVTFLASARSLQAIVASLQKLAARTKTKKDDAFLARVAWGLEILIDTTASIVAGDFKGAFYRIRGLVYGSAKTLAAVTAEPKLPKPFRKRRG